MKLRIQGNSIRIRLSKSEVLTLCTEGKVMDQCTIGQHKFHYTLCTADVDNMQAIFENDRLSVMVDPKIIAGWHTDSRVGFDYSMPNTDGSQLKILIEKDFVCLDNTLEDQSDNYPNPKAVC